MHDVYERNIISTKWLDHIRYTYTNTMYVYYFSKNIK